MCFLCEMGLSPQTLHGDPTAANGVANVTNTGVQNTDAILIGTRWDSTALTYTFPTVSTYFTDNPYEISPGQFDQGYVTSFVAFTTSMQTAARTVMDMFSAVSGLTLTEVAPSTTTPADIVFAQTNDTSISTASGRFPEYGPNEGHQWYRDSNYDDTVVRGTYTFATLMHETGHTMGLAHGHSADSISGTFTGTTLTSDRDSMEFSIMTYRSYVGASTSGGYTNEQYGYAQTLMMYDIAALQELYSANYGENAGNNTYTWSEATGEMFIDGVGQGAAGANRIFMTLWDGDGVDAFDLSNYDAGVTVDLSPGGWSVFDSSQLSNLGNGNFSRGNVFNALLYNNNSQSLIDNVIAGDGNDIVIGNRISNTISGNNGSDTLIGAGGSDTLYGGANNDVIYGDARPSTPSGVTLSGSGTIVHGNIYDTMGTALDVTNLFAQSTDANVEDSATNPHVTLRYIDASAGPTQWYAITVNAGSHMILDIDASIGLDSFINIYDANGSRLDFNDDNDSDPGSSSPFDSYYAVTIAVTGTYFVEVGSYSTVSTSGPLGAGDGYDLHVTVVPPQAQGSDGVAGNDHLYGGAGIDWLFGGDGSDTLDGGLGDDLLNGGDGADWLQGNSGNDTIHGGIGNDEIRGGQDNDVLFGEDGDDTMYGARGNDRLDGGNGNDRYTGGADSDTFVFSEAGTNVIHDFENGIDRIEMSVTGANAITDLIISYSGGNSMIDYGIGTILLEGVTSGQLNASDFVFI